jgi:hypothetical protein
MEKFCHLLILYVLCSFARVLWLHNCLIACPLLIQAWTLTI